jgi:hypothetical protein
VLQARMVFDSDLNRRDPDRGPDNRKVRNMRHFYPLNASPWSVPQTLVKAFRLEAVADDGTWHVVHEEDNNYQRLVRVPVETVASAIRLTPLATWGAEETRLFAFDVR